MLISTSCTSAKRKRPPMKSRAIKNPKIMLQMEIVINPHYVRNLKYICEVWWVFSMRHKISPQFPIISASTFIYYLWFWYDGQSMNY